MRLLDLLWRLRGALGAVVGGTPAGRRRLLAISVTSGAVAFSGAVYTCGSCTPLPGPGPAPTATPTATPTAPPTTPPPPPTAEPSTTTGEQPEPEPEPSKCVFVRPVIERAEKPLPASRIVGGSPALPDEANWMASLQTTAGGHFCGGSIYRGKWVRTAAHCVVVFSRFRVVVGRKDLRTSEGLEYSVTTEQVKMPAGDGSLGLYSPSTFDWDVALIQLPEAPGVDSLDAYDESPIGPDGKPKAARAWGWGRTSAGGPVSPVLLKVDVPIVSQTQCRLSYSTLTERMVCSDAFGKASCSGDSGGPLNIAGRQVGVVSHGIDCGSFWPGVYSYLGPEVDGYAGDIREWVEACAD